MQKYYPDNVAIIGGGRWARVISRILCNLVPSEVCISVHSASNAMGMQAWATEEGLSDRLSINSDFPSFSPTLSNAVIVVNAAFDHEKTVIWALRQRYAVLVEKPIALSYSASQRLVALAKSQGAYLASAHVFLFAEYFEEFSRLLANEGEIKSIRVLWMDPEYEARHGEAKRYDASLPVYADWLPHIIYILHSLTRVADWAPADLELLAGGAHLKLALLSNKTMCSIELVRNGERRQRILEVKTLNRTFILDFSSEPVRILADEILLCATYDSCAKPRPMESMLSAFLQGAVFGSYDSRLDIAIGLRASQLIDKMETSYRAALHPWLIKELMNSTKYISNDLRYALREVLLYHDRTSLVPVDQRIDFLQRNLRDFMISSSAELSHDIDGVIRMILEQGKEVLYV